MSEKILTNLAFAGLIALSPALSSGRISSNARLWSQGAARQAGQAAARLGRGGPVTNGLQVFIEAQRAPIPEDQPIRIVFHVANLGAANFDFASCGPPWEADFLLQVTTDRGESVSRSGPELGGVSCMSGRLRPGEEHVEVGDIRDQYALGPGKFFVTAVENYQRGNDPPLQAVSNTIEITVIPARERASSPGGLRLTCGAQSVFDPTGYVDAGLTLTNSGDLDIDIQSEKWERPWFHDVTVDIRTLSGDPVPRKRDADGREVPFEKNGWGLYTHRNASSGPLRPGDVLTGQLWLCTLYQLKPGTAYTVTTRVTLQTSAGPVELVSNTAAFVIRAN
jgi:hypothetical protein